MFEHLKFNITPAVLCTFTSSRNQILFVFTHTKYAIVKMFNSSSCPVKHQLAVDSRSFELDTPMGSSHVRVKRKIQEGTILD
jgi:hypothetical protein